MTNVIETFDEFRGALPELIARRLVGEVFPYRFVPPVLEEVVEQARNHEKVQIRTGQRGDRLVDSVIIPREEFRSLPLEEAVKSPIHFSIFSLGPLREPGGALADVIANVYDPLVKLWQEQGLKWTWVYPILFLSGPNCSTNYHWDPTPVLVIQLYGRKIFHSLKEPRKWCSEEMAADPDHDKMRRPDHVPAEDIVAMEMNPGDAVWIPSHSPHWVDAVDGTAFTLSLAFEEITDDRDAVRDMDVR